MTTRTNGRWRGRLCVTLAVSLAAVAWIAFGSGRFAGLAAAQPLPQPEFEVAFRKAKAAALADSDPKHPWAGVYTMTDPGIPHPHEKTRVIDSTGHYTYETTGCMGAGPEFFGRTRFRSDGTIEFTAEYYRSGRGVARRGKSFIVRWGERHYLLSADTIPMFKKAIEDGTEPRDSVRGWFLLRSGDWDLPVSGTPIFPKAAR
jgi:hypothetical protein